MHLTWQEPSLHMEWCLDCHRHPERYVRPREEVFNMEWQPPADQPNLAGRARRRRTHIQSRDDCTVCHR